PLTSISLSLHDSLPISDILTALPHVQAGSLRAIGLASAQRSDALPQLPTLAEQGLDGYDVSVFFGIVAPRDTPDDIVAQLNRALDRKSTRLHSSHVKSS